MKKTTMKNLVIQKISKEVYKNFPEVSGTEPAIHPHNAPQAKSPNISPTYVLVFKGLAKNPAGQKIPRQVRVIANANGKILRMSTSR